MVGLRRLDPPYRNRNRWRRRQGQGELGAFRTVGIEPQVSSEGAGQALAEGETQTDSRRGVRGVVRRLGKWAEQAAQGFRRQAWTVVADRDRQPAVGSPRVELDPAV